MSGTDASKPAPTLPGSTLPPGSGGETTTVPRDTGKRRTGTLQHAETRPPDRGRSIEDGLAELARRRAAGDTTRRRKRGPATETYVAPDGTRLQVPATALPAPGSPPAAPSLIAPQGDAMAAAIARAVVSPLAQIPGSTPLPAQPAPGPPAATPAAQPAPGPPAATPAALGDPGQAGTPVAVTIDGQPLSVPLGELVAGYLRMRDYSQKTQVASAQLRQAQEAHGQFNLARERLERRLSEILALDSDEFARPIDWIALSQTDPIGYSQKHARFLARQQMQEEQQRLAQLRRNEEEGRKALMLQTGHEALCQIVPGWTDATMRGNLCAGIKNHLRQRGYTDQEVGRREVYDPREVIMLLESMLWAQHIAQGIPVPTPTPAVPTLPGNGRDAAFRNGAGAPDLAALDDRFGRTHKLDDAVALLQARRRVQ